jgi:hypothetical protein
MDEQTVQRIISDLGLTRREIDPHIISDLATLKADLATHKKDREELIARDEMIIAELKMVREDINRMKGFIGGVAFVFSALGFAIGAAFSYMANLAH